MKISSLLCLTLRRTSKECREEYKDPSLIVVFLVSFINGNEYS